MLPFIVVIGEVKMCCAEDIVLNIGSKIASSQQIEMTKMELTES